jgi:hypothetical protein
VFPPGKIIVAVSRTKFEIEHDSVLERVQQELSAHKSEVLPVDLT